MNDQRTEEIKKRMEEKTTEELLQIWVTNNRSEWSDDAFNVVRQILSERKAPIPPQNAQPAKPNMKVPGKGFRTWAIVLLILGLIAQGKMILVVADTLPLLAACVAVSIVLGPAVAFIWYRLALLKPLATRFRYAFGCIMLGFGTFLISDLGPILLPLFQIAKKKGLPPPSAGTILLHSGVVLVLATIIFLLPAYLLCFKRTAKQT